MMFDPKYYVIKTMRYAGKSLYLSCLAKSMILNVGSKNILNYLVKSMILNVGENFYQLCLAILRMQIVGKDSLPNQDIYHNKPLQEKLGKHEVSFHKKLIKPKILHKGKLIKQSNILNKKPKMLKTQ